MSNVGPRIALAILSGVSVEDFHRCVEAEDVASLVRIPGIGRKTAERLLVEMRDRLKALAGPLAGGRCRGRAGSPPSAHSEAFSALIALGYKPAGGAASAARRSTASVRSTEEMIRHALRAAASA